MPGYLGKRRLGAGWEWELFTHWSVFYPEGMLLVDLLLSVGGMVDYSVTFRWDVKSTTEKPNGLQYFAT